MSLRTESGQATTELLVCMLVLAPMFFGVYYLARYADVKHSAIQASRYVAFERALDPQGQAKTREQLAQEVRARFFLKRNAGEQEIVFRDSPARYQADKNRIALWSDASYRPMLEDFNQVAVVERDLGQLSRGLVGSLQQKLAVPVFGLPQGGVTKAEVTVSLADVTHFDALKGIHVGLPGATAIATGAWNANGSKGSSESTCNRVKRAVLGQYAKPILDLYGTAMSIFERNTPDVGRVLPDYVPTGSLQDSGGRNVDYGQQDGNKC
ncbi:MAG: hypothetical protein LBE30_04780 [Comamonas sp.]|jgi:hypothetical protein|nr:hypothetical protein [Comamonas sp.]